MADSFDKSSEDVISLVTDVFNKLNSIWLSLTYPFASFGSNVSIHRSCDLARSVARWITIGNSVQLRKDVWLNIAITPTTNDPVIVVEDGCNVGPRSVISAKNRISIGRGTILAPSVLIMDHNHAFEDVTVAIGRQGTTEGGTIRIEEGCWIGFGAAIVCGQRELVIGRNSVIGANAVVSRSVPPYSVVTGNPARVVKHYDEDKGKWFIGVGTTAADPPEGVNHEIESVLHHAFPREEART